MSVVTVGALERGVRKAPYRDTVALLTTALGLSPAAAAEFEAAAAGARKPHIRVGLEASDPAVPPLRSVDAIPKNLPRKLTSFIGREAEIAKITTLLVAHQLVTLVGSGGVGKTRTSLAVAEGVLAGFADGVWLIELASLSRGDYIPGTVAQALGLTLTAQDDPLDGLVRALKDKCTLLVFDNCEHLVEPTARVVSALLRGCPNVKILASSRQVLGITGEETYRLPSLGVPNENEAVGLTASDAMRAEAVALFVERARAVDKSFALTDDNAPLVADVCRRLDGIPLVIELAAARVRILSPRQLRERLDERFRVLTGGSRDVLPRQQTLRAMIDWSHDLLDQRERTLFRRLGIFVNGFTLEGAAAVGSGDDMDELDVFDVLASLVDKSLVLAEPDGDSLRYRLLESTRLYALEKLAFSEEPAALASRHLRYLRNRFADLWARAQRTGRLTDRAAALKTELEDVRAALDGALTRSDFTEGAELLAAVGGPSWRNAGRVAEGIARYERYLAAVPRDESRLLARLSIALSYLLGASGRMVRALEAATEAVALGRESGDASTLASALTTYAFNAAFSGRLDEAEAALAEAEAIPEASASVQMRLYLLDSRAFLSQHRGDVETAARTLEKLRQEHRSLGYAPGVVGTANNLAELEHARGRTQRAIAILHETLPLARSAAPNLLAGLLGNLAGFLAAVDDLAGAVAAAREAIGINASREPDHAHVGISLEHLALVFALRGDLARAAILEGYADAVFARQGFKREFAETTTHDRLTALLRVRLSPDELARVTADGAALAPEAAIALALEEP